MNFWNPALIENLTMDYLVKVIEERVFDNLSSRSQIPLIVSSPYPLKGRSRLAKSILNLATEIRSYQKLYDLMPFSTPSTTLKVSS